MLFWVSETLVGFVPEGRYEGSDSTELAEVLARSAWGNAKTGPVPEGRYEEGPSASFIGWIMFVAIVRGLRAILQHSNTPSLRVAGFEDEDEYEAPCEA
jgi:hypothetical protein